MRSAKLKLELDPKLPHPAQPQTWANPVVPGDHPDPTIIRLGSTFWASATSGEWSPQFPLFRSNDLTRWQPAGAVFPHQPAWAEGSFWAPELVHDEVSGRLFCWYVARKRGGPLCIAVATAENPGGPWHDHGPLLCDLDGSIDPCFARNEHGEPYLLWKEDGNSAGRPTPIWAQPLSEDLLHLAGSRTQLITNDQPWEEGVVEGPYVLRHCDSDGVLRFYLFYAGNSCCGKECKYAEGVARSETLLGPWEKFPSNPIIGANDRWRCPGHGTAVHTAGAPGKPAQDYFLYHAYPAGGTIYVGREPVLDEITWAAPDPSGGAPWPAINSGQGPGEPAPAPTISFHDTFHTHHLNPAWQWPVNTFPHVHTGHGAVTLTVPAESPLSPHPVESAMIAVPRPVSLHYRATVALTRPGQPQPNLWAGLAIVGDPFNTIGLGLRGTELQLWERRGNRANVLWTQPVPDVASLHLRATSVGPSSDRQHHLQFAVSPDGEHFTPCGAVYDASDLPAWDRGLRVGLLLEGPPTHTATFHTFHLNAEKP